MNVIGGRLRDLREKSNLKQIQVMRKTGINNKTLSGYENGVSEPDFETLKILADFYNVSTDYLIGKEESQVKEASTGYLSDSQVKEAAEIFSALPQDDKDNLLDFMRRMLKRNK